LVFAVAYGYSGYPMIRQIREMVRNGELGAIQAVRIHYIQGGLRRMQPDQTPERAAWKLDPAQAGPSGVMADIGTHAFHLLRYTTELKPMEVSCHLATYHPVRPLEDYGHAVLRCADGQMATITASQVTHGRLNDIHLEIDGSSGSLVWRHEQPEVFVLRRHGQPVADLREQSACRLPGGGISSVQPVTGRASGRVLRGVGQSLSGGFPGHAARPLGPEARIGRRGVSRRERWLRRSPFCGCLYRQQPDRRLVATVLVLYVGALCEL
jgi:hypothetical protein